VAVLEKAVPGEGDWEVRWKEPSQKEVNKPAGSSQTMRPALVWNTGTAIQPG